MDDSDPKKSLSSLKRRTPKTKAARAGADVPNGDRPRRGRRGSPEAAPEPDPIMQGEYSYLVGKIEEVKIKGETKKALRINEKRIITETQLSFIGRFDLDELVALHVKAGKPTLYSLAERIGKAGTLEAEFKRHAYSFGNGEKFPPPVQAEAEAIEREAQGMIDRELKDKNLRSANDENWRTEYQHGKDRINFREMKDLEEKDAYVMTIDPEGAKDHDDALHTRTVRVNGTEYVEVGVHIADVTHFLSAIKGGPGNATFMDALYRAFTAYFPGKAFTMLPRILSDKLCSLQMGEDRLTLSTVFLIDPTTGKVDDNLTWYGEGVIKSGHHFTYDDAEKVRVADAGKDEKEENLRHSLLALQKYGKVLRDEREERKSLTFPERDELDVAGKPGEREARSKKKFETNLVVQDWMIKANEAFATLITKEHEKSGGQFPTLLRYHEAPTLDDLENVARRFDADTILEEIRAFRRAHPRGSEPPKLGEGEVPFENKIVEDFMNLSGTLELSEAKKQQIRDRIEKAPKDGEDYVEDPAEREAKIQQEILEWRDINRDWLRGAVFTFFKKAKYTTDPKIHFGLSLFPYTNATSPIRRFADIIVHKLVKAVLAGETTSLPEILQSESVKKIAAHLSAREIKIRDESKVADRMWAADFLTDRIGKEMNVRISKIERKKDTSGKQGDRMWTFQTQLRGGFPMEFIIPEPHVTNLPPDSMDVNRLINQNIRVKLLKTDPATGFLDLEFVSAPAEVMRAPLSAEVAEFLRQYFELQISKLEKQFKDELTVGSGFERALKSLKTSVSGLAAKTSSDAVDKWAETLGYLTMRLHKRGQVLPREAASTEPPDRTAPRPEPARPAPVTTERLARLAAIEREIAELQRAAKLRKLEAIEREIALLRARRRP